MCMKRLTPSRANIQAKRGFNLVRMDVAMVHSEFLREDVRREDNNLLLTLTVANPCAHSSLEKKAKRPGFAIIAAVKEKPKRYWGTFPATYTPITLNVSICGILGSDI